MVFLFFDILNNLMKYFLRSVVYYIDVRMFVCNRY